MKTAELKTVNLKVSDAENWFYDDVFETIRDDAQNFVMEELGRNYTETKDIKCYGDVSYTQGRGIGIDGLVLSKEDIEKITGQKIADWRDIKIDTKAGGRNESYSVVNDYCERIGDGDEPKDFDRQEIIKEVENRIHKLEKRLLKFWEAEIEYLEKDSISRGGRRRRTQENNIETEIEIRDINYDNEQKEGYIKICDSGDTSIELRIKPLELEKHNREIITNEDGKIKLFVSSDFYTLKD